MNQIEMHFWRQSVHLVAAGAPDNSTGISPAGWERGGGSLVAFAGRVAVGLAISRSVIRSLPGFVHKPIQKLS
jgi:hypothetical protein